MKILRKILSVSCLLMVTLCLASCGAADSTEDTYDETSVYAIAMGVVNVYDSVKPESYEQVTNFTDDELSDVVAMLAQQGLKIDAEGFKNGFTSYLASKEDLGEVVEYSQLKDVKAKNGTITAHIQATGTGTRPDGLPRTADIELVLTDSLKVNSVAFNVEQTTGEKLTHAGLNTLLGMGTTFSILILISVVIYLLSFVPKMLDKSAKKEKTSDSVDKAIDQIVAREEKDTSADAASDTQLIAVIAAAIAAYETSATGRVVTPDTFIVRSLKKH